MSMNVSRHDHPMHKGPHHDKYMHSECQVSSSRKGSHAMGDKSHLKTVMGEPKGADVAGHSGKMKKM
jgi:hypothetical protein